MNMDLPESYTYWNKSRKKEAYIENGILKLCTSEIYKKVIRELAYILNSSKHYCVYCNKSILNNKATLDHVYPQFLGGPTITNNLVPSCQNCNSEKSDFTKDEFIEYLCLRHKNRQKAKEFRSIANLQKECLHKSHKYEIPDEWLSHKEISKIYVQFSIVDFSTERHKYTRIVEFYNQYGYFQKPIIVDKNGFLLDGFYTILYAKNNNITEIPVIQLDNVEVIH